MGTRDESDDIRWRVVSVVTINDAAAVGANGLGWRRRVECAVEVLRRGSGTIDEVRERKMRGISGSAGGGCYLRLLLLG